MVGILLLAIHSCAFCYGAKTEAFIPTNVVGTNAVTIPYSTACGPISCYSALRWLGVECKLRDLVEQCEWHNGVRIPLFKLVNSLKQYGVNVEPLKLSPTTLEAILGTDRRIAIILPIQNNRNGEVDHVITVIGLNKERDLLFVSYPDGFGEISISRLQELWHGQAIIVSRTAEFGFWMYKPLLIISVMIIFMLALIILHRCRKAYRTAFFLSVLLILSSQSSSSFAGEITATLSHDFGVVDENVLIDHTFEIVNDSSRSIQITSVKPGCQSCITVIKAADVIPSRGKAQISIALNTKGKQGACQQSVFVQTKDTTLPGILLTMKGTVRGIWAAPIAVDLGDVNQKKGGLPHQVIIWAAGLPNCKVKSVNYDSSVLNVQNITSSFITTGAEDIRMLAALSIETSRDMIPPGALSSKVMIDTTDEKYTNAIVPITGFVHSNNKITPQLLYFGAIKPKLEVERQCTVELEQSIDDLRVTSTNSSVSVILESTSNPKVVKVRAIFNGNSNQPDERVIKGEIYGIVKNNRLFAIRFLAYLENQNP